MVIKSGSSVTVQRGAPLGVMNGPTFAKDRNAESALHGTYVGQRIGLKGVPYSEVDVGGVRVWVPTCYVYDYAYHPKSRMARA